MKKLVYNIALIVAIGLMAVPPLQAAEPVEEVALFKKEYTRTIKKEFDISAEGTVEMSNRHGKVEIKTWDQNQVKTEVTITVNAGSEEKAEEVFDRINIEFDAGGDFVKGTTTIESQKKSWMSSWWGGDGSSEFSINYEVYMPATCDLVLSNKYGHSTVAKISGKANVTAKYGDVRLEGVANDLVLNVGYGNATVESAQDAQVIIKYGKLRLEDVRDINLESKYSKVYIDQAGDLESISKYDTYRLGSIRDFNSQGKYDDFEIESANNITASARYSDYDINQLAQRGKFNLEYGGLKIENLSRDFSKLEVGGKYTDIAVEIEDGAEYELDIATSYAGINFPDKTDVHHQIERSTSHELRGFVGSEGAKSLVHVRTSYGNVKVK